MSAPEEFYVRVTKGFASGFAGPTPSEVYTLTRSTDSPSQIAIQSQIRPSGTPDYHVADTSLTIPQFSTLSTDDPKNVDARVQELYEILKSIPVESPPGSEDIYGLDIGIAFGSPNLEWANRGPAGCNGGKSEVQPTHEQKEKFKRAVEIVKGLATTA